MGQSHKMHCYLSLYSTVKRYGLQSPVNSHRYLKSHLKSYLGCWQLIRLPALDYSTQTLGEYQYFCPVPTAAKTGALVKSRHLYQYLPQDIETTFLFD